MSKEQNISIIKDFYSAQIPFNLDRVVSLTTEDLEWSSQCLASNVLASKNATIYGQDEFRRLFNSINDDVQFEATEFKDFLAEGDKVAVIAHSQWRNKHTGKVAEYDWIRIFTLRDGKIAKQHGIDCTACILEAFTPT